MGDSVGTTVQPTKPNWASVETKIKRVSKKRYQDTLNSWGSTILTISLPGSAPEEQVCSLVQLQPILKKVPRTSEERHMVTGVKASVLHEAIYCFHKAWHVGAVCVKNIESGRLTWAEMDAYQGAQFAAIAILGFFGISFPIQNAMLDVWPAPIDAKKEIPVNEIQIIGFQSLDHYVKWAILKRVLHTCDPGSPAQVLGAAIFGIPDVGFAEVRNNVHYQSHYWIHEDLFHPIIDLKFGRPTSKIELFDSLRQRDDNFGISLLLALLNLSFSMAEQISHVSATMAAELALIQPHVKAVSWLWPDCNAIGDRATV